MNASTDSMSMPLLMLQMRLSLARFGAAGCIVCLLFAAGIAAWASGVPYLRTQETTQRLAVIRAQKLLKNAEKMPPLAQPTAATERLDNFYDALGEAHYAEQQIKTLFAIADKAGLRLTQGEYKSSIEKSGHYSTYQILLPVKGSYAAIRQFCEKTLLAIPFASLDEMSFKREGITSSTLDAKLRFTLYLDDASHTTIGEESSLKMGGVE